MPLPPGKSALKATPKRSATEYRCPAPPGLEGPFVSEQLDLEAVRTARAAGVPEEYIVEMSRLAAQGRPRLPDFPMNAKSKRVKADPLSESDEEADVDEVEQMDPDAAGSSEAALALAITKLTSITADLAKQKKQSRSLDALLDGVGPDGPGDGSGGSGTRKYAAALRALRRTLSQRPEEIFQVVERNMAKDFQVQQQLPGSTPVQVSARAWLEMRSRVQGFIPPVRLLWGIAGLLDCLRAGAHSEARARACLLLAQGDQMAIDRGSWVVAAELSLEESPPMSAFQAHSLPGEGEAPYTRLIDGRWFDLMLQKINDYENLSEKKKKLSMKRTPAAPPQAEAKADPKRKPKGKSKGKPAGSGGAEAEEASGTPAA